MYRLSRILLLFIISIFVACTPEHVHQLVLVQGKAPNYQFDGWKDCYRCEECWEYYEDAEGLVLIGDSESYNAWKSPTGSGYLPKLHRHDLERVEGKTPTPDAPGWKDYYRCTICGELFEDVNGTVQIPNLDEWKSEGGRGYDVLTELCITADQNGPSISIYSTVPYGFVQKLFEYSYDRIKWTPYEFKTVLNLAKAGDCIYFRERNEENDAWKNPTYAHFTIRGKVSLSGNIMSMIDKDKNPDVLPANAFRELFCGCDVTDASRLYLGSSEAGESCFYEMFADCEELVVAPKILTTKLAKRCFERCFRNCYKLEKAPALPAMELAEHCYDMMFFACTSLIEAPVLPATELKRYCYNGMFESCSSLVKAPALPATKLAPNCYLFMFWGAAIEEAPSLPATTLEEACYYGMFMDCKKLRKAPELPATVLADSCYGEMFYACSFLTEAPVLPAKELKSECYAGMFRQSGVTYVQAHFLEIENSNDISYWLNDVPINGTFVKDPQANWDRKEAQIPSSWNLITTEDLN